MRGENRDQGITLRSTIFLVGTFFTFMLLFNGSAMYESAEKMEYGAMRDFCLLTLKPLDRVCKTTRLGMMRTIPADTVGRWLNRKP